MEYIYVIRNITLSSWIGIFLVCSLLYSFFFVFFKSHARAGLSISLPLAFLTILSGYKGVDIGRLLMNGYITLNRGVSKGEILILLVLCLLVYIIASTLIKEAEFKTWKIWQSIIFVAICSYITMGSLNIL